MKLSDKNMDKLVKATVQFVKDLPAGRDQIEELAVGFTAIELALTGLLGAALKTGALEDRMVVSSLNQLSEQVLDSLFEKK